MHPFIPKCRDRVRILEGLEKNVLTVAGTEIRKSDDFEPKTASTESQQLSASEAHLMEGSDKELIAFVSGCQRGCLFFHAQSFCVELNPGAFHLSICKKMGKILCLVLEQSPR
jgi:hypothetical protein